MIVKKKLTHEEPVVVTDDVAERVADANEADGVEAHPEEDPASFWNQLLENFDRRKSEIERIGKKFRDVDLQKFSHYFKTQAWKLKQSAK